MPKRISRPSVKTPYCSKAYRNYVLAYGAVAWGYMLYETASRPGFASRFLGTTPTPATKLRPAPTPLKYHRHLTQREIDDAIRELKGDRRFIPHDFGEIPFPHDDPGRPIELTCRTCGYKTTLYPNEHRVYALDELPCSPQPKVVPPVRMHGLPFESSNFVPYTWGSP